ncbi:MAG: ATP-grasp domain-containing protein [Acidaminococcaceae bacterium]|nr:ATP-grasp domain-containing protein [Acidaminococcaceae bacterium]
MLPGNEYVVKSAVGCGSQGIFFVHGNGRAQIPDGAIIQERCDGREYEITAEIFNTPELQRVFCRKRIATKSGVCTKAEPVNIPEIAQYIRRLTAHVSCPAAFCAQFLMHRGQWCMIDCNLRLGAGTALSTAAGFQLVRAFWANLCGTEVSQSWLTPDPAVKAVLRVYDEVVIR